MGAWEWNEGEKWRHIGKREEKDGLKQEGDCGTTR